MPVYQEMKLSEICNSLSHLYVLQHMIDNNNEYGLVLEDDVIFTNDFFKNFDFYFNQTPEDFDIIFLGSSFSPKILDSVGFEQDKPEITVQNNVFVYEKFRNPKNHPGKEYFIYKRFTSRSKKRNS